MLVGAVFSMEDKLNIMDDKAYFSIKFLKEEITIHTAGALGSKKIHHKKGMFVQKRDFRSLTISSLPIRQMAQY